MAVLPPAGGDRRRGDAQPPSLSVRIIGGRVERGCHRVPSSGPPAVLDRPTPHGGARPAAPGAPGSSCSRPAVGGRTCGPTPVRRLRRRPEGHSGVARCGGAEPERPDTRSEWVPGASHARGAAHRRMAPVGSLDTVHDGDRYEQVKLWGKGLRYLHVGDRVGLPRGGLGPTGTYSVAMVTGGFVHVVDGVITGWHEESGAGPQLTTGGAAFDPAAWPGGPFGPWYRDADAPPARRIFAGPDSDCPRHGPPLLRVVNEDDPDSRRELAGAAARADVRARLAAGLDEEGRIAAAREYLADRKSWVQVSCEAAATLLGVDDDPVGGGARLLRLLSSADPEAPEWSHAASLLAERAADLPAPAVAACLRLLAAALPPGVGPRGEVLGEPAVRGAWAGGHA